MRSVPVLAVLLFLAAPAVPAPAAPKNPLASPENLVRTALLKMGGVEPLKKAGGVTLKAEGTFDLSARLQGRNPDKPEPTPIAETLSVDLKRNRLAYRLDWFNYQHSNQKLMELHDEEGRVLYVDERNESANWSAHSHAPDQAQRYRRLVPHLLLAEALQHTDRLSWAGTARVAGSKRRGVAYKTPTGDLLILYFDVRRHRLEGALTRFDMPVMGDTAMSWWWSGYEEGPDGLRLPSRLKVRLGGKMLKSVKMKLTPGADRDAFKPPRGIHVPEPPDAEAWSAPSPAGAADPQVRDLGNGLHLVVNLRPGFHVPFVEFDDFVAVIDAPSIWYEMQHVPPMNWSGGDSSVALGRKLLRAVRQTTDKPVKYLVLTHHHTDHIGGLRPFLDAGATIVTGPQTAKVARRAAAASLELAGYEGKPVADPDITIVEGEHTIRGGERSLKLIALPDDNPQSEDFLMAYLPESKTLYATAFIYPVPESVFPLAETVGASKWFVRWLDGSGLDVETHLNIHGQARVQPWQMEKIREMMKTNTPSN